MEHFKQEDLPKITLQEGVFRKINPTITELIEAFPSFEEIIQAVKNCGCYKASGYDGFNMRFIKETWDVLGIIVKDFVK